MIDEVKQTDKTENLTQDAPEEIARDTAEMDFQAEAGLFSEEAGVDENAQADVEAEADTSLREEMEAEIAALEQEVETQKAQLEDRTNQYMRIAADFENFRKRTQKEKEELELQIKCATITELLAVVDNFERAQSQIKTQTEQEKNIHKSYQSVYKLLVSSLKRLGVSPMRPKGKEFDPNLHEAVGTEQTDEYPEGTVTEELMPGYYLGEKVLRHAMVKVAAAPEPVVTSEESQPTSSES
ncbi:nucleotide exchange factor GrpE [Argonema antarcticum]|uniref:nucleotide exchange factor GrpE n=1 Tax=Argonema antarcticum TaxID=2942763 RepID=UPI002012569E|nr:nucleotide exchange factor GrpE [Argonema antarcticum]MCL1472296.1 nucleotide exchange factor GrpE [Argonema antarcticum A004/B2]